MSALGLRMALRSRSVCSSRDKLKYEWTDTPTTSSLPSALSGRSSEPSLSISHSLPLSIRILPPKRRFTRSISAICFRRRFSSRPRVILRRWVWSVIAIYLRPLAMAKAAMAKGHGRLGHGLDGGLSVGPVGLDLKIPLDILISCERRQLILLREFDLPGVLPHLRFHIGEAQRPVEILFRPAGHLAPAPKQAVFVQFHALAHRQFPQGDVMVLGTGEIVQGRPVGRLRDHPQVDVEPGGELHGRFGPAVGLDPDDVGHGDEILHDRPGMPGHDQDIYVPDGFPAPAQGTGDREAGDLRHAPKMLLYAARFSEGEGQEPPPSGSLQEFDAGENALFGAGPESGELPDALRPGGFLEAGEIPDAELFVQPFHVLGAQTLHRGQGREIHRRSFLQFDMLPYPPGF